LRLFLSASRGLVGRRPLQGLRNPVRLPLDGDIGRSLEAPEGAGQRRDCQRVL